MANAQCQVQIIIAHDLSYLYLLNKKQQLKSNDTISTSCDVSILTKELFWVNHYYLYINERKLFLLLMLPLFM